MATDTRPRAGLRERTVGEIILGCSELSSKVKLLTYRMIDMDMDVKVYGMRHFLIGIAFHFPREYIVLS